MFWEVYFPDTVFNPGALDVFKTGESRCMWVQKNMLIDWTTWWHHRILGQACVISLQFVSLSLFLLLLKLCSKAMDPGSCRNKLMMHVFIKLPILGHCYFFSQRYFAFEILADLITNSEGIELRVVLLYWVCVFTKFRVKIIILEDTPNAYLIFCDEGGDDGLSYLWGGSYNIDAQF